ncbi:MAG: hypothetical protein FIB08_13610 [Candidatus Methanoperedens sp.]|nr:hypothetical protein [Candidatus Methanoperedens sp.]
MGFLGTAAGWQADTTLLLQVAGFIILLSGIMHAKKKIFLRHFQMARITVALGIISLIWMVTSLVRSFQIISSHVTALSSFLTLAHATIGVFAMTAGILLAFDRLVIKTKAPMRTVFIIWAAALFLGIIVYIRYYIM